jgi:putative heme iron utilization protein
MTTPTAHDGGAPAVAGDAGSFPSHAELVRTLLGDGGIGTLSTQRESGHPYGSLAAYSVLTDGSPLVCISDLAEHTRNARRDPRAGLFVAAERVPDDGRDPLDEPRASIVGDLAPYEPTPAEVAAHFGVHPRTADYADFPDFHWWRMTVAAARFVGGFGSMSWVDASAIAAAEPDPVLPHAGPAVDHMNRDHAEAALEMVRALAGLSDASTATVHAIDRHGMTLYAATSTGHRTVRLAFRGGPLDRPDEIRDAAVDLDGRARAVLRGSDDAVSPG